MNRKALMVAILTITFVSGSAWAGNFGNNAPQRWGATSAPSNVQPQAASKSKVVGYTASFNLSQTSVVSGTCPDGYANQCASGTCECHEFSGTGKGSTFGTASTVSAEITVDLDNQPGDPDGTCFPAFGVLSLTGSKDNEVVNFVGAACNNFDHSATFTGGFEFDQASSVIFDAQGPTATGKFVGTNGFQFKLTGKACKGTAAC